MLTFRGGSALAFGLFLEAVFDLAGNLDALRVFAEVVDDLAATVRH